MRFTLRRARHVANILTVASSVLAAPPVFAQMVGLENEYATVQFMEPKWGEKHMTVARELLGIIKKAMGDQGTIRAEAWTKKPELNYKKIVYKDPQGRKWEITPEVVNTGGHDGLEFVTPPLESEADINLLETTLKEFKKSKQVMRGLRSSNHLTIDVSKLLKDKRNISELVDLILTIENHWADIYRVFDPIRYGTIINRFGVPLAVDQQDLLRELAELPPQERSFEKVAKIFQKYEAHEKAMRDPDGKNAGRMWKYRAANYGKLFGLGGVGLVPAIEFRIGDIEMGSRLRGKVGFLRALVNSSDRDRTFKAPFGMRPLSLEKANERLKQLVVVGDSEWLTKMGVSGEAFSRLEQAAQKAATARTPELIDANEPVDWNGKRASIGFEIEFSGDYKGSLINSESELKLGASAPKYLDSQVDQEETGNFELRSRGGEWRIAEVLEQMGEMKQKVGEHMRGFHGHVRVPKEAIETMGVDKFNSWMSLVNDSIMAWRLENKSTHYSIKTETQTRLVPDKKELEERGTIRATDLNNGWYDIEIRGYMREHEKIGLMFQRLLTGLKNPSLVNAQIDRQVDTRAAGKSFEERMDAVSKRQNGKPLTENERSMLTDALSSVRLLMLLPLYRFEDAPTLSAEKRKLIRDANQEFYRKSLNFVRKAGKGEIDPEELGKQILFQVKSWGQEIGLTDLLERQILSMETVDENISRNTRRVREALKSNSQEGLERTSLITKYSPAAQAHIEKSLMKQLATFDFSKFVAEARKETTLSQRDSKLSAAYLLSLSVEERAKRIQEMYDTGAVTFDTLINQVVQKAPDAAALAILDKRLVMGNVFWHTRTFTTLGAMTDAGSAKLLASNIQEPLTTKSLQAFYELIKRTDAAAIAQVDALPVMSSLVRQSTVINENFHRYAMRAVEVDSSLKPLVTKKFSSSQGGESRAAVIALGLTAESAQERSEAASSMAAYRLWMADNLKWLKIGLASHDVAVLRYALFAVTPANFETLSPALRDVFVQLVSEGLADPSRSVQYAAHIAKSAWPDVRLQSILLQSIKICVANQKSYEVERGLSNLKGSTAPGVLDYLMSAYENSSQREGAIAGLGGRQDPQSLTLLMRTLESKNASLRQTAIESLGGRTEPSVIEKLESMKRSEEAREALDKSRRALLNRYGTLNPNIPAMCKAAFGK